MIPTSHGGLIVTVAAQVLLSIAVGAPAVADEAPSSRPHAARPSAPVRADIAAPALKGKPARREFDERHMGSVFHIVVYSDDEAAARRASRAAFDRVAQLDDALSDYNPASELSRLCNQAGGPPVPVGRDLLFALERAVDMAERSQGAFDPTVGPVVRLWRRARRERKLPDAALLNEARALVGYKMITIDHAKMTVQLAKRGMKLDLGGLGKGMAAQAAFEVLKRLGFRSSLVAGDGDIVVGDAPPGRDGWIIEVDPLEDADLAARRKIVLTHCAISSSGDAERYVEINGKRYAHIVDPRTGVGVVDRAGVTVVAPDGTTSDSIDTAAYVLGPERGLALIQSIPHAEGLIVRQTRDGLQTWMTPHFMTLTEPPGPALKAETAPR